VFLLDEPLSNLDAKLRADLRGEIKRLHERTRRTTVYVTHDQMEAMTLASRVAVLNEGRIQQCGPPAAVYQRPVNLFVASFVGAPAMKFIEGSLRLSGTGDSVTLPSGGTLPLPLLQRSAGMKEGQPVTLGVRPEAVHLVPGGTGGSVEGSVTRTEHTGPDVYVTVELAGSEITARVAACAAPRPQQQISALIDGRAANLFNPRDGSRLN
jgi:multiple sugar transport system ATP-binding protein